MAGDVKRPHPTERYREVISALRALLAEEGDDVLAEAVAEVTSEPNRETYLQTQHLTPSDGAPCIGRLLGRDCPGETAHPPGFPHSPPADDNPTLLDHAGAPAIYLSQPFGLTVDHLREIVAFCDRFGLRADVSTWPSWHFPGSVLSVSYARRH